MRDRFFSKAVKLAAWRRAKGCCQQCETGIRLRPGDLFYDHVTPHALGGESTLENCQVLCRSHHAVKTFGTDVPMIARAKRLEVGAAGIREPRSITGWRRFDGTPVRAERYR